MCYQKNILWGRYGYISELHNQEFMFRKKFFCFCFLYFIFFLGLLFIYLNFYYCGILKKVFNLYRLVFIYSVLRDFHVVED